MSKKEEAALLAIFKLMKRKDRTFLLAYAEAIKKKRDSSPRPRI